MLLASSIVRILQGADSGNAIGTRQSRSGQSYMPNIATAEHRDIANIHREHPSRTSRLDTG
jgi:hypothetical protein